MKSEIKFISPSVKVTVAVGVFFTILVIALAVLFRFEFGVILLSLAGVIILAGGGVVAGKITRLIRYWQISQVELDRKRQELRLLTYKADKAQFQASVVSFPRGHRIVTAQDNSLKVVDVAARVVQPEPLPQLPKPVEGETLPPLLEVIKGESSIIFTGPKRSGKTNNALWWLAGRGACIVCDPKNENAAVNQWPNNCKVVGSVADINQAIDGVMAEMHNRRKTGNVSDAPLTLFFDEIHYLISEGVKVVDVALSIATLGAEFGVYSAFTAHAITAKYLNISGAALLENFTIVRASKVGGVYRAYVDQGEGEQQVKHPGPYAPSVVSEPSPVIALTEAERIEQAILRGDSNNQICRDIWGSKNADRIARINVIRGGV